ncbi:MAG: methyltransferase domain-containing protein [Rhodocyclaceae bacterium]|nr:methyltransferase domain-containing protein [Rhodocyclaceae bacterium]MDZ4215182.1 methyltransferase domain-containing protein [Rhodocyclaceae bacterium]
MTRFDAQVAARFDAAAGSYDAHSAAQRHAAQRLVEHLVPLSLPPRPRILEIGCGTGHLTERLARHFPGAHILATDIAPAMLAACQTRLNQSSRIRFNVMDGCRPASADFYDLICGNLVAQWFDDLPGACARLAAHLAPGGTLLLSLPGGETFREWKAAHTRLDLVAGTQPLPTPEGCRAALPPGDNRVDTEYWIDRPADGLAFLRGLRAIGADTAAAGHIPLAPAQLRRVLRELGPAPSFTYELIYLRHRAP